MPKTISECWELAKFCHINRSGPVFLRHSGVGTNSEHGEINGRDGVSTNASLACKRHCRLTSDTTCNNNTSNYCEIELALSGVHTAMEPRYMLRQFVCPSISLSIHTDGSCQNGLTYQQNVLTASSPGLLSNIPVNSDGVTFSLAWWR